MPIALGDIQKAWSTTTDNTIIRQVNRPQLTAVKLISNCIAWFILQLQVQHKDNCQIKHTQLIIFNILNSSLHFIYHISTIKNPSYQSNIRTFLSLGFLSTAYLYIYASDHVRSTHPAILIWPTHWPLYIPMFLSTTWHICCDHVRNASISTIAHCINNMLVIMAILLLYILEDLHSSPSIFLIFMWANSHSQIWLWNGHATTLTPMLLESSIWYTRSVTFLFV